MKRFISFIITMVFAISVIAQTHQVIASAGGYNENGGQSISWTLGGTITSTLTSPDKSVILTQGFQEKLVITAVKENPDKRINIQVFPNPVSEVVNIQFKTPVEGDVILALLDSQGNLLRTDLIESSTVEKQINLHDIPAGIYYFRMTQGKIVNVYKVVKL